MPYKHGTYGVLTASKVGSAVNTDTAAVYVGTAPVGQIEGYAEKNLVNVPLRVRNLAEARQLLGQSDDWESYTLMEAVGVHFDAASGNVGPIYVINVLDPATHVKSAAVPYTVALHGGRGSFASDAAILDTVEIAEKTRGTDYNAYFENGRVWIESIGDGLTGDSVSVSVEEMDADAVTSADLIGTVTAAGVRKGLAAVDLIYQTYGVIPALLAAPGWSHVPDVYTALLTAATKINGHWDAVVLADIPLTSDGAAVDTITKALTWKATNGYSGERSKVFWPEVVDGKGRTCHLSTVCAAAMLRTDAENDGVPYESPSNKPIDAVKQYFGDDAENQGFDQAAANDLNAAGITTAVYWGGLWKLWGPHTAAYAYGADVDARAYFDAVLRMLMYVTNGFQERNATYIDAPLDLNTRDTIINAEQQILDSYAARGALLGTPTVEFVASENSAGDIAQGDFTWHLNLTPASPLKSATAKVTYTDDGFEAFFGGEV